MDINIIKEKIQNDVALTDEEIKYYLDNLKRIVKENVKDLDYNIMQCGNVSKIVSLYHMENYHNVVHFSTNDIGIKKLTHYSSFLPFKSNQGIKWFIVDFTAKQFDTESYPLDQKFINIKKVIDEDKNKRELLTNLENDGYVILTPSSLTTYVNIFIDGLKKFGFDINKLTIQENLIKSLEGKISINYDVESKEVKKK